MIGRTLGHYRIESKLGQGGMGVVYRAHDETLDRDVALKVLSPETLRDEAARARFRKEALALSRLNHPNICTIHEIGEADGQAFLAMEYVEGRPLRAVASAGALPVETVLRYGFQIADALAHAHARGIVHRDLKSANVMVTPEGRIKVLDFGLARRMSQAEAEEATRSLDSLTEVGTIVGTLHYMAPEVFRGETADARSDLWALGVVLHEVAAGELPFRGQTGFEVCGAILNQPPDVLPEQVPPGLQAVIGRCLTKAPGERYQRAEEVRAALETIQSGERVVAPLVTRRRLLFAVGALVVALASIGLWRTARGPRLSSIAVLPLENLSGDPAQEYFVDGMTEALITDLARLKGLKGVIGRGSVMRYKGSKKPLAEIARELNVDALITGAVLRAGGRVRITAQLINPANEQQLWADRYERDLQDVLALQNEIVSAIIREIRVQLTPGEQARLASARPVNPEAYDDYLKGRFHWQKLTQKELDTAEQYFQLAVQKDPNYALAYTGIGVVWGVRVNGGWARPGEGIPKWKEAIRKAVELDPALPEVQTHQAGIRFYVDWDWAAAESELRRAVELAPSFLEAHVWYSEYLLYVAGRLDEGVAEMRRALELDPHNSLCRGWVGQALVAARRYDEAIAWLQQVLRDDPNMNLARGQLVAAFEGKQMYQEALAERKQAAASAGDSEAIEAFDRGYARGGYPGAMRLRAELAVRRSQSAYVAPTQVAGYFAAAGDKDLAVDWLEKAYEEREVQMVRIKGRYNLRNHPRFQGLLRRMKLPVN